MSAFDTKHPAFVLSLYDTGLITARGLARHGIKVVGLDWDRRNPGFHSRLFSSILCPPPYGDDDSPLLAFLEQQASISSARPVLYPASDAFVGFIARNAKPLARRFLFNIPEPSAALKILAKHTQAGLARKAGAVVPKTILLTLKAIDAILGSNGSGPSLASFAYPAFLKPVHVARWQRHIRRKVILVRSPAEMQMALRRIRKWDLEAVAQEMISGPCHSHFEVSLYVDTRGRAFGPFIMRKWRSYPRRIGTGTYGTSIKEPKLARVAQSVALNMGIRGFANMEFKYDVEDDTYKFIEVNPRVWQQVTLAVDCGLDLPLIQYLDLTNQTTPEPTADYKVPVHWIDPPMDFVASVSFAESLRAWRSATTRGILAKDDPWPAIRALLLSRRFLGFLKALVLQRLILPE